MATSAPCRMWCSWCGRDRQFQWWANTVPGRLYCQHGQTFHSILTSQFCLQQTSPLYVFMSHPVFPHAPCSTCFMVFCFVFFFCLVCDLIYFNVTRAWQSRMDDLGGPPLEGWNRRICLSVVQHWCHFTQPLSYKVLCDQLA